MKRSTPLKRSSTTSPLARSNVSSPLPDRAQISLTDKLIETIRNLSSNKDLLNTRLNVLNNEGLKTASIMEIAGMYRSLVSQVAVLYDTDEFQTIIAPFIEKRFVELGSPSLIPGTIGSYIFGCYLSDYGLESLNKFCTPICAASIRVPNRNKISMRCTEKVIWTDGGDTPIFILIEEDPNNSTHGKVFIPWVGPPTTFKGLTQGAIDEIRSMNVNTVEIYGQLFNNKYMSLLLKRDIGDIPVVERVRIKPIDYVNSKNGGLAFDTVPANVDIESPKSPVNNETIDSKNTTPSEGKVEKKEINAFLVVGIVVGVVGLIGLIMVIRRDNKEIYGKNKE
jgi:hypothetical protein